MSDIEIDDNAPTISASSDPTLVEKEDSASVEELNVEDGAPPSDARTVACINSDCKVEPFGSKVVMYSSGCCNAAFCQFCFESANRNGARCPNKDCNGILQNPRQVYWAEDLSDSPSTRRDITREVMLERHPRYQELEESGRLLVGRANLQAREIESQKRLQALLDDQIRQGVGRVDALALELDKVNTEVEQVSLRTASTLSINKDLRAQIQAVRAKKYAVESVLATIEPHVPSSSGPI